MLTMEELLRNLAVLQGVPAVLFVVLTAALLLILQDLRWAVSMLAVQYAVAGLLFAWILEPNMAGLKLIVGLFVCLMLYFTGRQVGWGTGLVDISEDGIEDGRLVSIGPIILPSEKLVRAALALLVGAVALLFLPPAGDTTIPVALELAAYVLVALGLVAVGVHERPFRVGIGLLTFLTGFDLLYSGLAFSKSLIIFFTAVYLAIALITNFLSHRQYVASIKA
jgi:hypothetical protein